MIHQRKRQRRSAKLELIKLLSEALNHEPELLRSPELRENLRELQRARRTQQAQRDLEGLNYD